MWGFSCLWVTLFSCMFAWRRAMAAEACEALVAACFNNYAFFNDLSDDTVAFTEREESFQKFCRIQARSGPCLDIVAGDYACEQEATVHRLTNSRICSHSFQETLDFEWCLHQVSEIDADSIPVCVVPQTNGTLSLNSTTTNGTTADGVHDSDICNDLSNYLTCVNDTVAIACDRGRELVLYYLTLTNVLWFIGDVNEDCPLTGIFTEVGAGPSLIPSRLHWIMVTVATLAAVSFVR